MNCDRKEFWRECAIYEDQKDGCNTCIHGTTEIEVSGFIVHDLADPSVGIMPQTWELSGDMLFNDKDHLEEFRGELQKLMKEQFEGKVIIHTFEEQDELNNMP